MKLLSVFPAQISFYRSARRATLEGPTLVLAEAEQHNCTISTVYVSRHTDPQLICRLQKALGKSAPIVEVSVTELRSMAAGRPHGGVVAIMVGRRPRRRTERGLWSILRLAVPDAARSPEGRDRRA